MMDLAGGRGAGKQWGAGFVLLFAAPVVLWWVVTGYVAPRPVAGPFDTYTQCATAAQEMNEAETTSRYRCALGNGAIPTALRRR
jgi:hypothetical protein